MAYSDQPQYVNDVSLRPAVPPFVFLPPSMDEGEESTSLDLGLVNTSDVSSLFLKESNRRRRPPPLTIQARRLSSSHSSPSSPDLSDRQSRAKPSLLPSPLGRSRTLPRSYFNHSIHESISPSVTLLGPSLESNVVHKLRRWILCIIMGEFSLISRYI